MPAATEMTAELRLPTKLGTDTELLPMSILLHQYAAAFVEPPLMPAREQAAVATPTSGTLVCTARHMVLSW